MQDLKILQRELKCYDRKEVTYDVYCDRVNFCDSNFPCHQFFRNRQIILDRDRAGYSISIKDAQRIGLPTEYQSYRLLADSRKKPLPISKVKTNIID